MVRSLGSKLIGPLFGLIRNRGKHLSLPIDFQTTRAPTKKRKCLVLNCFALPLKLAKGHASTKLTRLSAAHLKLEATTQDPETSLGEMLQELALI